MRMLTIVVTSLGIALFSHTSARAQTLGDLTAAQGVGASVSAADASSSTTARAARDAISGHLGRAPSDGSIKSGWADKSHGATATAKGWASPRTSGAASGKAGSWVSSSSAGPGSSGNPKGWVTADSGRSPGRR
jgi:hypothetical protein